MANLNGRLDQLVIGFQCGTSWEHMTGDGVRRFCDECRRDVFDFARMRPAEIRDHLQASRGMLCARLTRQGGRLVTAPEVERAEPAPPCAPRHVPALTAGLFAVCLSAGVAQAGEPAVGTGTAGSPAWQAEHEPAAPEPAPARQATSTEGTTLRGRVTAEGRPLDGVVIVVRNLLDGQESSVITAADGAFRIARLPAGMYEIEGNRAGFAIAGQTLALQSGEQRQTELMAESQVEMVTAGVLTVVSEPLRRRFDASDLVAVAEVGSSVVVERKDETVEVWTDLHVESLVKGVVARGGLTYRHSEYETGGSEPGPWQAELVPGTHVLALLERSKVDLGKRGRPIFEAVDGFGLTRLDDGARAAYLGRLEALAHLERQAERRGETNPADLVEWLVATAENPFTRGETVGEIGSALDALAGFAAKTGEPMESAAQHLTSILDRFHDDGGTLRNEPPSEMLGALLTPAHQARLTAALRWTATFEPGDRALFLLVRRWDEAAAGEWLLRQLRTGDPKPAADQAQLWWFAALGGELGDDGLRTLATTAAAQQREIEALGPEDTAQETRALRQQQLAALLSDLRRDFAALLARQHQPRTK
jgi:hypothetical protein